MQSASTLLKHHRGRLWIHKVGPCEYTRLVHSSQHPDFLLQSFFLPISLHSDCLPSLNREGEGERCECLPTSLSLKEGFLHLTSQMEKQARGQGEEERLRGGAESTEVHWVSFLGALPCNTSSVTTISSSTRC